MKELRILFTMAIVGFAAQYIDGSLGMGYGVSLASFLLVIGFFPALASASIHLAEIFTTAVSALSHIKFGNVRKDIVLPLLIPGCIGGGLGAYFIASIPGQLTKPWIAGILLILGIIILIRFLTKKIKPEDKPISRKFLIPLAAIAGFCDASAGGGWGPIATPSIILTNKSEPRKVVGSVDTTEFFVTLVISTVFIITLGLEIYNWILVSGFIIGGIIAAPLAAWTVRKIAARLLGVLVGIILILINLKTILK